MLPPDMEKPFLGLISTALRSGTPIPQITPCPLLDRFLRYNHGFNVVQGEGDDEYGLPKTATIDLLEDKQYMYGVFPHNCIPQRLTFFRVLLRRSQHGFQHREPPGQADGRHQRARRRAVSHPWDWNRSNRGAGTSLVACVV